MIANKWYCIAQSGTFDSGCIVDVTFDGYSIQFSVGIRYGSSSINITRCNLPSTINLSARLRQSNSQWSVDLLSDKEINPQVTVADSPFWVAVNTEAGAGNIVLSLTNISKEFNTETGGGSGDGFNEDMLRQFLKDNGYTALLDFWKWTEDAGGTLTTKYNIVVEKGGAFGKGSTSGGGGGTGGIGTVILRTPTDMEYTSDSNGVVNIPNWVTSERINGLASESWVLQKNYLSKSAADELYAAKDDLDELKSMWSYDEDGNLHTTHNIVVEKGGAFGAGSSQGGGTSGLGNVTIYFEGSNIPYQTNEQGIITLPAYPTALKNPHALKINGVTYDGSKDITINLEGGGGIADSVAWENVQGRPTALSEFENDIPYLTEQKASDTYVTKGSLDDMWYIDDNGNLHTRYNLVVDGGGAFGKGSTSGGGGTSGGLGSVIIRTEGGVEYKTNASGVVTVPNWITASALNGYATQTWVEGKKYITGISSAMVTTALGYTPYNSASFTKANIKSTLGIADWALATSKPSYSFSEIGSKPTTAAGYGIVDALTFTNNGTYVGANMPSSDLSNLAASAYIECWDSAGWWNWKAAKWITVGGTSSHFVKGDGSLDTTAYLPLSGGVMDGAVVFKNSAPAIAFLRESGTPYIRFGASTSLSYGEIGTNSNGDAVSYSLVSTNSGYGKWNVLLHTNNYSSYALPLTGGTISGTGAALLTINRTDGNPVAEFRHKGSIMGRLGFDTSGNVIGVVGGSQVFLIHSGNIGSYALKIDGSNAMTAPLLLAYNSSLTEEKGMYIGTTGLSGGGAFDYASFINIYDRSNSSLQISWYRNIYVPQVAMRISENGSWSAWKTIAFTDSNVASATKLQTARTIWGQSFDGTGNVSGSISNVSEISFSNNANTGVGGTLRFFYKGSSSYTSIILERALSQLSINGALYVNKGGNVLIGTTTDNGYKLQVNGDSTIKGVLLVGDDNAGQIHMRRPSANYIWATSNSGYLALGVLDKGGLSRATSSMVITANEVCCGTNGAVALGTSTYRWGKLYGTDADFSTNVNIGGNLVVTGGGAFGSDARYKNILANTSVDLATIANAPLFTYKWNDRADDNVYLGTTAQYWLDTNFKDTVNTSNSKFYHLDYGALGVGIGIAVAREVKGVKTEVEQLREEVKGLKEKLNKYEQQWHN